MVVWNLIESGELFDNNAACLLYMVTKPADSPDDIWVVDVWTTEEEQTKALQAPAKTAIPRQASMFAADGGGYL